MVIAISNTILENIEEDHIRTYLRKKGIKENSEENGTEIKYWLDQLLSDNNIDIEEFEKFLYRELSYGKRRYIRVYKLDKASEIKMADNWLDKLKGKFEVDSLNVINVLKSIPNSKDYLKIAAVESNEDRKGQLEYIKILFVRHVQVREGSTINDTSLYFPTEIDFKKKRLYIKTWNRINLEQNNRNDLLDDIKNRLETAFGVHTKDYSLEHKKVLYSMSQGLISNIYNKIPAYNDLEKISGEMEMFEEVILKNASLIHTNNDDGKIKLPKTVIDFHDELRKLLEKLVISDYFFDKDYEDIWGLGVDTIISKIRFKDLEHILTSLNGESSEVPIICTKTFLALKKSLEDSEHVDRIWIHKNRKKGKMSLTYDASNGHYLDIIILSNIRYTQEDINEILEMYESYGSGIICDFETKNRRDAV